MPLTSEQITAIVKGLGECVSERDGEKRRRAVRVKHRDTVTIVPYADGLPRTEQQSGLVDFSSRGVAIHFSGRLPAGSQFVLVLPQGADSSLRLLCSVAHCRKRPDGGFGIGAEFVALVPTQPDRRPLGLAPNDEARRIAASMFD